MRPTLKFLNDELIIRIVAEAREVLCKIGVVVHNNHVLDMLSDYNAEVNLNTQRVLFSEDIIDKALKSTKKSFKLYNAIGDETNDFSGYNIHFTPGSAAIYILDYDSNRHRKPVTNDYIKFAKIISSLDNIAAQSTAFIPSDVHDKISDSYRLYLSLLFCEKPVITGCFTIESFNLMKEFQIAVRGSANELKSKPLTIFSCCPTSPLGWSEVTSQNVIDCAKYSIPIEFIPMPLSGFIAPVTIVGTLIQHTAEALSGIIISQLANPGTPVLYGGSPAVFDVRNETTPMGAIETMMIDCAYNEIGKYLNIPTQAYISLSDSKLLDTQAGLETSFGATLAALSGINSISGPGMLDFENCISLEKLIVDNEICGMALRMVKGIEPKEDFPSLPIFEELLTEKHLLISDHTLKYIKEEHHLSGNVINRAKNDKWLESGALTINQRAHQEVEDLITKYRPSRLSNEIKLELKRLMLNEAKTIGMDKLPEHKFY